VAGKDKDIIFQVMPHLFNGGVHQRTAESGNHFLQGKLGFASLMPDGDVVSISWCHCQGNANQFRQHGIGGCGLRVQGNLGSMFQQICQLCQFIPGLNNMRGKISSPGGMTHPADFLTKQRKLLQRFLPGRL